MSIAATLRKGLKYLLMSFGASSPEKKPAPKPPAAKSNARRGS